MSIFNRHILPNSLPNPSSVWGWDRDLVRLPDFDIVIIRGATEAQVQAGLSISAGALVIDTNAMVAAGGDADLMANLHIPSTFRLGAMLRMDVERDMAYSSMHNNLIIRAYLRDVDGVVQTPDGGSTGYVGGRLRNDGYFFPYIWENPTAPALVYVGSTRYTSWSLQTTRSPGPLEACHAVAASDATYTSGGGLTVTGPRDYSHAQPPYDEMYLDASLEIHRNAGLGERIWRRIPRFEIYGTQA